MSDDFATAMQLLLAERPSLDDVQRAATLLEVASSKGHSGASERLALLDAMGSARPQNWNRSLDLLALAAPQVSQSAQRQLLLLANSETDFALPADADGDFWRAVRS